MIYVKIIGSVMDLIERFEDERSKWWQGNIY